MSTSGRGAWPLLTAVAFHAVALATALAAASYLNGAVFWQVGDTIVPVYALCAAYGLVVCLHPIARRLGLDDWLLPPAVFTALAGLVFLALLLFPRGFEKADLLSTLGLLGAAVSLYTWMPRQRTWLIAGFTIVGAVFAGLLLRPAGTVAPSEGAATFTSTPLRTSVYDLEVRTYTDVVPKPRTHLGMGALQRLEDAYVVAMADGGLFSIRGIGEAPTIEIKQWKSMAPLNYAAFLADAKSQSFAIYFRVTDIAVGPSAGVDSLFVAHHFWHADRACATLRISSVPLQALSRLETAELEWSTVFETAPCVELQPEAWAFRGMEGGGRLAFAGPHELLLTVGDHGFNGVDYDLDLVNDPGASYGKTLSIDPDTGEATVLSTGHRNQQGLLVGRDGIVWATEHGPEGGDELNALVAGGLYGWPQITYGTDYGTLAWPLRRPDDDSAYTEPLLAWVPSIGVSSLAQVDGPPFDLWDGDLLVGSLIGATLYRVHLEDGVVRFAEPIRLNERIRDVVVDDDGIVIWTDSRSILHIVPGS